jgi:hypothetical protein
MLLILLDDFLMHGVVLQNRVFRAGDGGPFLRKNVSRETSQRPDVSRETIFSGAAQPKPPAPRCFT